MPADLGRIPKKPSILSIGPAAVESSLVATTTGGSDPGHNVGLRNGGNCIVVYDDGATDGDNNLFMSKISAAGVLGRTIPLATSSDFEQNPRLAINHATGDFVVSDIRKEDDGSFHVMVREFFPNGFHLSWKQRIRDHSETRIRWRSLLKRARSAFMRSRCRRRRCRTEFPARAGARSKN